MDFGMDEYNVRCQLWSASSHQPRRVHRITRDQSFARADFRVSIK
jgi:hypothetical protein